MPEPEVSSITPEVAAEPVKETTEQFVRRRDSEDVARTTGTVLPVEAKATETVAAPEAASQESTEGKGDAEHEDDSKLPAGVKKRLAKLTARNKEANDRAAAAEAEVVKLREPKPEVKAAGAQTEATTGDPEPQEENFPGDWKAFLREHGLWSARQVLQQQTAKQQEAAQQADLKATFDAHNQRISEARAKYDDFDEAIKAAPAVTFANPNTGRSLEIGLIEAENSADLMYHFAHHPEELTRLAGLSPARAMLELGRLSASLLPSGSTAAATPAAAVAPAIPISRTPAPITPVSGTRSASSSMSDPKMSTAEWIRKRDDQERASRRT